jgi:hypothetical protein
MTSHNAPRPRGRPSLTGGRAQTVQTSLSEASAAWVRSRPEGAAAYLRGLVEREIWHAAEEAKRNEGVPVGPLVMVA